MQLQQEPSHNWDMGKDSPTEIESLQRRIDELTTANQLLQEQLARKEQYNALVAHELRGPLSPIISYAQIVARPDQRAAVIQRGSNIIISQAWRLDRIVNDLLDASLLATGQFTLQRKECDIVKLAKEVVELLRPIASHHTLVLEIPDAPITGNWDEGRLRQVLGNLLDNAVKYASEESTITVRVETIDVPMRGVHVSVHNQGAGIHSEEMSQLFQPFVRLPATVKRQGSGLGLYITRTIVEAHGGKLDIARPTTEGQGTTFWFELPF